MWENTDQKKSEYGHFLGNVCIYNSDKFLGIMKILYLIVRLRLVQNKQQMWLSIG